MADSNSNIVSIVGILAILILVGLGVYFVLGESEDDLEVDLDTSRIHTPALVA